MEHLPELNDQLLLIDTEVRYLLEFPDSATTQVRRTIRLDEHSIKLSSESHLNGPEFSHDKTSLYLYSPDFMMFSLHYYPEQQIYRGALFTDPSSIEQIAKSSREAADLFKYVVAIAGQIDCVSDYTYTLAEEEYPAGAEFLPHIHRLLSEGLIHQQKVRSFEMGNGYFLVEENMFEGDYSHLDSDVLDILAPVKIALCDGEVVYEYRRTRLGNAEVAVYPKDTFARDEPFAFDVKRDDAGQVMMYSVDVNKQIDSEALERSLGLYEPSQEIAYKLLSALKTVGAS